jgi:hypothetical protein
MSVHLCKECGKTHRPKCDECGSTRDLRSYHGPCGNCAFKKESQIAFLDELEKISLSMGQAGTWAAQQAGKAGKWVAQQPHAMGAAVRAAPQAVARGVKNIPNSMRGAGENIGNAVASFASPRESLRKGWEATWRPGGKSLNPLFKGLMAYGAYNDVKQMMPREDPTGQNRSRIHRGLAAAGAQAGGIMSAPFGMTGGIVGSLAGAKMGDLAGRAVDRVRGYKKPQNPPHLPPPPIGQQQE